MTTDKTIEDTRLQLYFDCLDDDDPTECFSIRNERHRVWGDIIYGVGGSVELYDQILQKKTLNRDYDLFEAKSHMENLVKFRIQKKPELLNKLMRMAYHGHGHDHCYNHNHGHDNERKFLQAIVIDKKYLVDYIFTKMDQNRDQNQNQHQNHFAQLFFCLNPKKYIYDESSYEFYKINDHGIYVHLQRQEIKKDVYRTLNNFLKIESDTLNTLIKIQSELKKSLNSVVDILAYLCANDKINNVNDYLFAFDNGVYDFKKKTMRDAEPNEYVTYTCGYNYEEVMASDIKVNEIKLILADIFPNEEDYNYTLTTLAMSLIDKNDSKINSKINSKNNSKKYVWKGTCSGRSVLLRLIAKTFGNYFASIPISNKKFESYANSHIMGPTKECRLIRAHFDDDSNISHNAMKFLNNISSGNIITGAKLYSGTFQFVPKFNIIIETDNDLDVLIKKMQQDDSFKHSTLSSFKHSSPSSFAFDKESVNFLTTFVDEPTKANEIKRKDLNLDESYRMAFFKILIDHYHNNNNNNNDSTIV